MSFDKLLTVIKCSIVSVYCVLIICVCNLNNQIINNTDTVLHKTSKIHQFHNEDIIIAIVCLANRW